MRPHRCPLVLAVVCLLAAASAADAQVVLYPPAPSYSAGVRLGPAVRVYPQVSTIPSYYSAYPSYYYNPPLYPAYYGSPYYGGSFSYSTWGGAASYPMYPYGGYYNYGYSFRFRFR